MTKLQQAEAILGEANITGDTKDKLMGIFKQLEKPTPNGRRPEDKNGQAYCRYTGEYWDYEYMVFQNPEHRAIGKHKGYSKEGIRRWNLGGKHLARLKDKALDLRMHADKAQTAVENFDRNDYRALQGVI